MIRVRIPRYARRVFVLAILMICLIATADASTKSSINASIAANTKAPNVILQSGNAGNSTIFSGGTSASVSASSTVNVYYPNTYTLPSGTYSSGTLPADVNAVDSNYFKVNGAGSGNGPHNATTIFYWNVSTAIPSQLNITFVEQYATSGPTVTIQMFNFTGSSWVTSGQGYFTYSASTNIDQTQTLTINTNVQQYTSSGVAEIRIGAACPHNCGQWFNVVKLSFLPQTYDYILKVVNLQSNSYDIRLNATSLTSTNIGRLSNFTAWFHTPASGVQLKITGSGWIARTGSLYNLPASTTIFVEITLATTGSGSSTVDSYLQIYSPGTNTHTDYRLTFRMS